MDGRRLARSVRRTLLPALTVVFVLSAMPGPGRLSDRSTWRTATVERQFAEWSRTLSALGVDVSRDELEDLAWHSVRRYLAVRSVVTAPLAPAQSLLGLGNPWSMFTTPQTDPGRLVVEAETHAGWQTLYARGSNEHTFLRSVLEHHRMRKFVGRLSRSETTAPRRALADWLTKEVAVAVPDATRVRVSSFRWQTPAPGSSTALLPLAERGNVAWSLLRPLRRKP